MIAGRRLYQAGDRIRATNWFYRTFYQVKHNGRGVIVRKSHSASDCWIVKWDQRKTAGSLHESFFDYDGDGE